MHLKEIAPAPLYRLEGYLGAVSDFIRTGELKWYFDAVLFEVEGAVPDIKRLVSAAYPDCRPEGPTLSKAPSATC